MARPLHLASQNPACRENASIRRLRYGSPLPSPPRHARCTDQARRGSPLMAPFESSPLRTPLPIPARGASTRVRAGRFELILEGVRGGHSLLWVDGRDARRFALGLGTVGHLALELEAPVWPCRIVVRETLVVVPGGRIRGYVQVPLVPTVVGWTPTGTRVRMLELANTELAAEWDESIGTTFRVASAWHMRFPLQTGEPRATIPIAVRNRGRDVLMPADLPLSVQPQQLAPLRNGIVTAPRRLVWDGQRWSEGASPAVAEVSR